MGKRCHLRKPLVGWGDRPNYRKGWGEEKKSGEKTLGPLGGNSRKGEKGWNNVDRLARQRRLR